MRAGFQRFWLSALAKFVTGDPSGAGQVLSEAEHGENASLKIPHGAYVCRLATRLNSGADIKEMIKNLNNETCY
jgi:hypothetical protein